MVILVDANVILTYILNREDPYLESSIDLVRRCAADECEAYIAFHSLSIIWYVLKEFPDDMRRWWLSKICEIFRVAVTTQSEVLDAIGREEFKDFEDCLQDKCAKSVNADYIVTSNISDFTVSEIKAVTPDEIIEIFHNLTK